MNSLNWTELGDAFDGLASKSAADRGPYLDEIQARNPRLAEELASLLKAHDSADGFFEERVPRIFGSMAPNLTLAKGQRLLHFEIVELLGEGSLAKVYLARDLELQRLIALKVTLSHSQEAKTLAHFSIDGIVQVYSEHLVEHEGVQLRLMCLQFIAGPTLAELTHQIQAHRESGVMPLVEKLAKRKVALEPQALKWREHLTALTMPEAIVLLGMRLAEILHHAHTMAVLHLDIKPANILIDPYGRPYLSDFNVSTDQARLNNGDLQGMGGTPHYMAPEQARFFESGGVELALKLDVRSDVFALGVVIKDLLITADYSNLTLTQILEKATHADQALRTESAERLAQELGGWLRTGLAKKEMPRLWHGLCWIETRPLAAFLTLTVLSQLVASAINISYNQLQIVSALTPEQNKIFFNCVTFYNLIVYPLTNFSGLFFIRALFQSHAEVDWARKSALRLPLITFLAISFGWLPGAWVFPRMIDAYTGPLAIDIYWQFAISFSLAWLISLTTSLAVSVFVVTRGLYPKYWQGQSDLAETELRPIARLNQYLTLASALFPMSGVLLIILMSPLDYSVSDYRSFKILILATVAFGLINLLLVQRLTRIVETAINALKRPRPFA